jgi:hypothetical protein
VAWRDALELQPVVEHAGNPLDLVAGREDQMEAAGHRVEARVDRRGVREDRLDTGMRAPDEHGQASRGADGERHLVHLDRPRSGRPGRQHVEPRQHLARHFPLVSARDSR